MHYRKLSAFFLTIFTSNLLLAARVFAAEGDVGKVENFFKSLINMISLFGGLVAILFIVIGGYGYITSAGHPEALDKAKKTLLYAGVGLAIILGANVLVNIISDLATKNLK